jgi:hypothetical protein
MKLRHGDPLPDLPYDDIFVDERERMKQYRAMQREQLRNSRLGRLWTRLRGKAPAPAVPQRDA